MLNETLLQGQIFFSVIYFGILAGIVITARKLLTFKFKALNFVLDLVLSLFCGTLFLIAVKTFNYGEFRVYLLLGFTIGVLLEQFSLGNLVSKFFKLLYNIFVKLLNKLKTTKIFRKVLK